MNMKELCSLSRPGWELSSYVIYYNLLSTFMLYIFLYIGFIS